jgi:LysR family glycine cleavage system transcriptional activator
MVHLPSIQTLRAFEAACRLRSYSRAAEELNLTHGAISHRIRELEERLGLKLFRRAGNTMVPTVEATRLMLQVGHGLSLLEEAFAEPRPKGARRLVVTVLPAFANRWLAPRLPAFRAHAPDIQLEIRASHEIVDLAASGVDAALRYGPGGWAGVEAEKLAGEIVFPVCAPDYHDRMGLETPADLRRCTLLRHPWQPWSPWLKAAGVKLAEPASGPSYDDAGLLLQAAAGGEGVALARGLLVQPDLDAGRLVRPFAVEVPEPFSYWLAWPAGRRDRPEVAAFRDWLRAELAAG